MQGEYQISAEPGAALTTTLGSCVAACIRDPEAGIGGMNHFLLPYGEGLVGLSQRYGAYAMELLINALLSQGARREALEAKLFGGARLSDNLPDIGAQNVAFAEQFIDHEGIRLLGGSVGGRLGRRVQYWPVSGRVRQLSLVGGDDAIFDTERRKRLNRSKIGDVEFFDT
jgi:chemotaxis protein CheD